MNEVAKIQGPQQTTQIISADIVNITWTNIKFFKPQDLNGEQAYQKFYRFIQGINEQDKGFDAKECFDILWRLINNNPNLLEINPGLLRKYLELLLILRANFISLIGDKELVSFLQSSTLYLLSVSLFDFPEFDFKEKINLFLTHDTWYLDKAAKESMRDSFFRALESNNEFLGTEHLVLKNKKFKALPIMANWIADYNLTVFPKNQQRGAVERVTYLSQSPNIKNLDEDQKKLLLKFLEFYDWLRFGYRTEEKETGHILPTITKTQQVVAMNRPPPPATSFDQRLAQPGTVHGQDLEVLRQQVAKSAPVQAPVVGPQELEQEIERPELSAPPSSAAQVKPPSPPTPLPGGEGSSPATDIRKIREGGIPPFGGDNLKKVFVPSPVPPRSIAGLRSLNDIKVIDDLKKIQISHLRQGPVSNQIQIIKSKIAQVANANHVLPYYAVVAFEQSPLFKVYLEVGSTMIADPNQNRNAAFDQAAQKLGSLGHETISFQEFEAVADLRKEIERL